MQNGRQSRKGIKEHPEPGLTEQDRQNRTGRTGQAEQDRQNRTSRTGQTEQDKQNRTDRMGQALEPGFQCGTAKGRGK